MILNKKGVTTIGTGAMWFIGIVLLLAVGSFIWVGVSQMTADQQTSEQIAELTETQKTPTGGSSANVKVFTYDQEGSNTQTPVSTNLYVQEIETGTFVEDATNIGVSSRENVATETGRTLKFWAGVNSTWYAHTDPYTLNSHEIDPMNFKVEGETPSFDVWVHKIATTMNILPVNSATFKSGSGDGVLNITSTAGASNSDIDRIEIKNNGSDSAYQLGGLYADLPDVQTNISTIDLKGSTQNSGVSIVGSSATATDLERLGSKDDFIWDVDADSGKEGNQPIMLHEGDKLITNALSITPKGAGCDTGNGGDLIELYIFDKACFRSAKSNSLICNKMSNDAETVADVGGADFKSFKMYCK